MNSVVFGDGQFVALGFKRWADETGSFDGNAEENFVTPLYAYEYIERTKQPTSPTRQPTSIIPGADVWTERRLPGLNNWVVNDGVYANDRYVVVGYTQAPIVYQTNDILLNIAISDNVGSARVYHY